MKNAVSDQKYGKAALVVAVLALVVAVGGGAYAAAVKLKKNQVTTKVVKNNAITTSKLANASVTSTKLGTVTTRSKTLTALANDVNADTVSCNSDEVPLGGGAAYIITAPAADVQIRSSFKDTPLNGWRVAVVNNTGTSKSWTIEAYCLKK